MGKVQIKNIVEIIVTGDVSNGPSAYDRESCHRIQ